MRFLCLHGLGTNTQVSSPRLLLKKEVDSTIRQVFEAQTGRRNLRLTLRHDSQPDLLNTSCFALRNGAPPYLRLR